MIISKYMLSEGMRITVEDNGLGRVISPYFLHILYYKVVTVLKYFKEWLVFKDCMI